MQDTQPAFVLSSEAVPPTAMNDTPEISLPGNLETVATDQHLMLDFSKGRADAFAELFRRYKQPIFAFFRRRVADSSHAEELTQEIFLAVIRAASRYQPRAPFRTYLYAIAFKILRAHRRKAAFRATFLGEWKRPHDPAGREDTENTLLLRQTLRKLDHTDREILMLREFEQLTYAEIADLLHIPLNTVRSRLFRARLALRDLLEQPAPVSRTTKLAESEENA